MDLRGLSRLFHIRDLRNAAFASATVVIGISLAGLTMLAHNTGNTALAGILAAASLFFVLLIVIFVVPPLARNAGREASQMNLPFEFTTGGAVMLVLITVVGFSAWNTGNNLLFLVLSFLLAGMVVGFFAGRATLKKLDVKLRFPETIFAGEATPILVSVTNRKRLLPSYSVVAEVRGTERDRSIAADALASALPFWIAGRLSRAPVVRKTLDHLVYVPRRQAVESSTEHTFANRGRFRITEFELSTRFPFGFFRHRRRLPARETELVVFPPIVDFDNELADIPLDIGRLVANKRGMGQDLLALREYQPNDDLRRVDWKATARSQRLTVREFSSEDERRVTVVFDLSLPDGTHSDADFREKYAAERRGETVVVSERFERGASIAAAILLHFAEDQAELRLVVGNEVGEYGVGHGHLYDSLRRISSAEPDLVLGEISAEPPLPIERILSERADSHRFLVTANTGRELPAEFGHSLKLIGF